MELSRTRATRPGIPIRITRRAWGASLLWIGIGLLGLDLVIRSFVASPVGAVTYVPGLGLVPAAGSTVVNGSEGFGITHYAANGEIFTPFSTPSGADVVLVGDSHTVGAQVNDDERYPAVAAAVLQQDSIAANFHNLAASGSGGAYFTYMASYMKAHYHPAVAVIQVSPQSFGPPSTRLLPDSTYYFQAQDGSIEVKHQDILPPSDLHEWVSLPRRTSAVIAYSLTRWSELTTAYRNNQEKQQKSEQAVRASTGLDPQAQANVDKEIDLLHTAYTGLPTVIIFLPYVPYIKNNTLVTSDPTEDAVRRSLLRYTDWRVVDPQDGFMALVKSGQLPRGFANTTPGQGHLNAAGHAVVGRLLATQLEDLLR